jgi:acyl-CoA dehydrogenase
MADETGEIAGIVLEQAERLFAELATAETLRGADALTGGEPQPLAQAAWAAVAEAGFPLALAAEAQGGIGLPATVAFALLRRAAYHALPLPLGEAMLGSALWAAAAGTVPEGVVTLAAAPLRLVDGKVSGQLRRVPWGGAADAIVVPATDEAGEAFLVLVERPSGAWRRGATLAGEPRDTLDIDAQAVAVYPAPVDLEAAGATLRAVQMVGAMERALDHALTHAGERRQFGRAIAKFQAVQHMLAEAAGHLAAASAAADGAVAAWGSADMRLAAGIGKARSGEAAGKVAAAAHQVLAAMGFTQEHQLHYVTRRLWSWRDEFGGEAAWEDEIGRLACAGGGAALWDLIVAASQPGQAG